MQYQLTATIVTFKHRYIDLQNTIDSFLKINLNIRLFIVDNSPQPFLADEIKVLGDSRIEYIFSNKNNGFGAGHNIVLKQIEKLGKYHIVLNPDIFWEDGEIEKLFRFMDENENCGLSMPKVLYPNGSIQFLAKLLPTPRDWVFRRFLSFLPSTKSRDEVFELRFTEYDKVMNVPYLSGCFMFLRRTVIKEIGLFDEGIFMYGEDTDLTRRIHKKYQTLYLPFVTITHEFQKASHKNFKLLWIHIKAAVYYFNKWGWFFDKEREAINKNTLLNLGYYEK